MTRQDLTALLPLIVLGSAIVLLLVAIAWRRSHRVAAGLGVLGLGLTLGSLGPASSVAPRQVTPLLLIDGFTLFFAGLLIGASLIVVLLAHGYFRDRGGQREELYVLLLLATLGSVVLVAATHFASLVLGLELLSVSLYGLISYPREDSPKSVEAGIKYLVLAGASSAFLLFGMALVYAAGGSLELQAIAGLLAASDDRSLVLGGLAIMLTGIGFKLALVPFHLWTPDVYAGAPAPITAFIATVSKGAMFAVVLRLFLSLDGEKEVLVAALSVMAIASMLLGNLLALLQTNVKRLLAYSSIAHLGYLIVALLAAGSLAAEAASFYIVAYFVTTLGAFGTVTALSGSESEAEEIDDYRGLFWRRPALAAFFTATLLSLAGIPLTAGFFGKFYVLAAGVESELWLLVLVLVLGSAIGLFYYLRVIVAMLSPADARTLPAGRLLTTVTLGALALPLIALGVYPAPLIRLIQSLVLGQ